MFEKISRTIISITLITLTLVGIDVLYESDIDAVVRTLLVCLLLVLHLVLSQLAEGLLSE